MAKKTQVEEVVVEPVVPVEEVVVTEEVPEPEIEVVVEVEPEVEDDLLLAREIYDVLVEQIALTGDFLRSRNPEALERLKAKTEKLRLAM
jgi:hypothetical protein